MNILIFRPFEMKYQLKKYSKPKKTIIKYFWDNIFKANQVVNSIIDINIAIQWIENIEFIRYFH